MALSSDGEKFKVTILHDTGASQSLLLRNALPKMDANITKDSVIMRDLSGISTAPLANIYLDCPIKKGNVMIGIREVEFPVIGVTLLLGNGLAGCLISPNIIVTEKPVSETLEPDSDCFVNPSCVVTRSQKSSLDEPSVNPVNFEARNVMSRDNLVETQKQDNSLSKLHDMTKQFLVVKLTNLHAFTMTQIC